MRILGVSFNNFNKKNVSFGRFLDENARKVTKEVLYDDKHSDEFTRTMHSFELKTIEECPYVDVYTDKNDGKVKAKWDREYLSPYPLGNGKNLGQSARYEDMDDVVSRKNAVEIPYAIRYCERIINGETIYDISKINTNYAGGEDPEYGLIDCARRNAEEMPYW